MADNKQLTKNIMSQIENSTISVSKAAVILVAIVGFAASCLGAYYSGMSGVKDGFTEIKLELKDVKTDVHDVANEMKIHAILINGVKNNTEVNSQRIDNLEEKVNDLKSRR